MQNIENTSAPVNKKADTLPPGSTPAQPASDNKPDVEYSCSPGFVNFLARQKISVAMSSYQSGRFYLIGRHPRGGIMIDQRLFPKAMGIGVVGQTLWLATLYQIHRFENVLQPQQSVNSTFDALFVPRQTFTTGMLDAHDIAQLPNGTPVFVNTLYNCLATPSVRHSFKPYWRPSFISRLVAEDRCHLNGLAMVEGLPAYVTAVSQSDTIDGWRDRRADGGIVIDVRSDKVVCTGLSMPHSPRWYQNKLWLLNAGTGELGHLDLAQQKFIPLTFCPGFLRGLAFAGNYALVGLSKPRYKRFEGLALDAKLQATDSEAWCGIQVIDLTTGACVEWLRIDGAVTELYDLAILSGIACPMSLGFAAPELRGLVTIEDPDNDTSANNFNLPPAVDSDPRE